MNGDTTRRPDETTAPSGGRTTRRGQSEVIAVVLLLVIVVLSLSVLVASGTTAIVETRDRAEIGAAEHALAAFDTDVSAVAFGQTRATTDLGLRANDGEVRYREGGWIRVTVDNETSAETVVVNESLGAVEYRQGETTVAAQGGGVWRSDGDGSVLLSRPEFHYRDRTLTLPVVSMDGETGLSSRIESRPAGAPGQRYPNRTAGLSNPPDSGSVTVTVHSEYYDAWGRYFEDETDAIVTYDHANERVTVTFVVLPSHTTFDAGLIATSSAGELTVAGTGAYVDSYDSSTGNYSQTKSADGLIQSAGDFTATGDSLVDGDVKSGGTVELQGSTNINGSVYWTKAPEPNNTDKVAGEVEQIDGVRSVNPIDTFVETYADSVETHNDNDRTTAITDDQLTLSGSSAELDAGRYYVHNVTLDGGSLTLNTTDGDVTVVVRDYVELEQGGNVTVVGDGIARFVVAGENDTTVSSTGLGSKSVNFHVGKDSAVHVPGEDSRQLRVYGNRDFNATIAGSNGNGNNATFDGLVYAPAGTDGSGYVYVMQGHLYGLAVTGNLTVGNKGRAHYDYGLKGQTRIRSPFSELEQLYVTVHRVQVRSED